MNSTVRPSRPSLPTLECLSLRETAKKFGLEAFLSSPMAAHHAKLAFLSVLDGAFRELARTHPGMHAKLFGRTSVVLCDVGCGLMPYGAVLAYYLVGREYCVV